MCSADEGERLASLSSTNGNGVERTTHFGADHREIRHQTSRMVGGVGASSGYQKLSGDPGALSESLILKSAQLVRLLEGLRDLKLAKEGSLKLDRSRVDLRDLLERALDSSRAVFEESGQDLRVKFNESPILIQADAPRMLQALGSFLVYIARSGSKTSHWALDTHQSTTEVTLKFQDGQSSDKALRLLTPRDQDFHDLSGSERSERLTRIGFRFASTLVKLHGGRLLEYRSREGKTQKLLIRLPLEESRGSSPINWTRKRDRQITGKRPRRVLVVDDDRLAAVGLSRRVSRLSESATVEYTTNPLEGLEIADRFRPEIVFLDIEMPEINGFEFTRRFRAKPEHQEVLIVTATGSDIKLTPEEAAVLGIDHQLSKPVRSSELQEILSRPTRQSGPDQTLSLFAEASRSQVPGPVTAA